MMRDEFKKNDGHLLKISLNNRFDGPNFSKEMN